MTISPVEIRWWNASGVAQDPVAAESVFDDLQTMLPLPPNGLIVRPYVGRIDMGNSVVTATPAPNRIDNSGNCSGSCPGNVFGAVSNFEGSNQPGLTIGITTAKLRGNTSPVPFFRPLLEIENIAVASTAFGGSPLKLQVAHEVMHQSGFLHASGSCNAQSQLSEAWPPDLRGRLQGIGLDRRTGSGPTPGTYAVIPDQPAPLDAYDVMWYLRRRSTVVALASILESVRESLYGVTAVPGHYVSVRRRPEHSTIRLSPHGEADRRWRMDDRQRHAQRGAALARA